MCLYSKIKRRKIAKEDIVVYKILTKARGRRPKGKSAYITYYQDVRVPEDGILVPEEPLPTDLNWSPRERKYVINEGAIHSYEESCKRYYIYEFKAIIPKGSWYYKGVDGNDRSCYASEKLIIDFNSPTNN